MSKFNFDNFLTQFMNFDLFVSRNNNKAPKILISLRAFDGYYIELSTSSLRFGYRFNKIQESFESILSSLKSAGAELIFVSKSPPATEHNKSRLIKLQRNVNGGMKLLKGLESGVSIIN